ncbi:MULTISPECIES: oligosaccharide flippase family protein [unclassified Mycolicibacterium]|uniref:oligosaccharide flippase family protein n=1 Tax=unclassified Mycolicibacterium TaxID=2636767 RepID=UPI00139085E8|nr:MULTISPECIES: oligosaccharide flippase family protein [unclassified Mycolicibacterium]
MTRPWTAVLSRPLRDTTLRTALRSGSWALAGTAVGRVAHVAALLLAANRLGSAQFGGLSLALSTALVVTSVSALGLPVAVQKLVAEARDVDPVRRDRLIDLALGLTASVGFLTMIGGALTSVWVADRILNQPAVGPLVAVASIFILTTPMVEVLAAVLAALERFDMVGLFRAVYGCLCGAVLVIVLLSAPGAKEALWGLAGAEALTCVFGLRLLRSARGPRSIGRYLSVAHLTEAKSLLRISGPALLAGISLQPSLWLGQVLLGRQSGGLEHIGTFAVAMRWHSIALFVPATMGSVLLPMLGRLRATGRDVDARALFVRYGVLTAVFSTTTGLGLIAFAGPIMGLQGAEYSRASMVLVVLAVATVPVALNNVLGSRALAEGRVAIWMWSDVALAAALAGGAIALVPALNDVGLAAAYLTAYVVSCLVLLPIALAARASKEEPT